MTSKVGTKSSLKVTQKHKPTSPSDEKRPAANTVVAFGDGCFGSSYKGKLCTDKVSQTSDQDVDKQRQERGECSN